MPVAPLNWQRKVIEALVLLVAVALVARVVFGLLGPLLAPLIVLTLLATILFMVVRGPHAKH